MPDHTATFVNVFDVEPERQQELVDVLTAGAREVIRRRPGFVSLELLASLDGTRVVNVARWQRPDDARATTTDPAAAEHARRAAAIATANPGLYRVVAAIA
ncbi:MAG TPA: antibiotic biosynthesis monooxygenase [Acidimicrobiales bacterium]